MAIIIEGFDNSGKSTLAHQLGLPILHPGPRPKNADEEAMCLQTQLASAGQPVIMDRVTAISQPAYAQARPFQKKYKGHAMRLLNTPHCVLIYCRPPMALILDFSTHEAKEYDSEISIMRLRRDARRVVANYDSIMASIPCFRYDYTKPDASMLELALEAQHSMEAWNQWNSRTK